MSYQKIYTAQQLKEARTAKKISMRKMAEALGVSAQSIVHYEQGKTSPSRDAFNKMKEILGLEGEYGEWFRERKETFSNTGAVCSVEGCGQPARCRGRCMKHYAQEWKERKGSEEKI